MNKEEKKAIEDLRKEFIADWIRKQQRVSKDAFQIYVDKEDIDNIGKVLNLIEKQDKMIDYMAGRIVELLEEKNITNHSKKDIIDIFKNLAVNNLLKEVNEDAKN